MFGLTLYLPGDWWPFALIALDEDHVVAMQVADVCVEALVEPAAADKVVEIIADVEATSLPMSQLFQGVLL